VLARLARVEAALRQWDEYAAAAARAPGWRRGARPPPLSRATLVEWRRALAEELAQLPEAP
jgi:hypothetical protein